MTSARPRLYALLLAAFTLAAACNSTSDQGKSATVADGSDRSGGDAVVSSDAAGGPAVDGGSKGGARRSGSVSSVRERQQARASAARSGRDPGRALTGRGVTAKEIKIGINYSTNLQTVYAVVGFGGPSTGEEVDEKRILDALVKYINGSGGMAGRKLVPIYYAHDAAGTETNDAAAQATCSRFIEDERVFAATSGHVGGDDSMAACMTKGRMPFVQQNQWPYDSKLYKEFDGFLYQPSRLRGERYALAYIDGLKRRGFFDRGARIGLMRFDDPLFDRLAVVMKRRLAKFGLKVTTEVEMTTPRAFSELGGTNSELSNAILRFRTSNITHVIFDEYAAILPFFMVTQAESQGYRPRYGLSSVNLPGTVAAQAPDGQLHRSIAVSWTPGQDVPTAQDPRKDAGHLECMKALKKNGIANPSRLYGGTHCDNLFFLRTVLSRMKTFTPEAFEAAVNALGTAYASPYTWKARMSPGRHDGATIVRDALHDDACGCYKYLPGSTTVP